MFPCEETAFQGNPILEHLVGSSEMLEMHFNTLFRLKSVSNQWKSMKIMTKSHAETYGSHEMVRVKIALSRAPRAPERAHIRRLYGCMTSVEVEGARSVAWPAGVPTLRPVLLPIPLRILQFILISKPLTILLPKLLPILLSVLLPILPPILLSIFL